MPQKILLYRFPTEKMAGIHPHALEKNRNYKGSRDKRTHRRARKRDERTQRRLGKCDERTHRRSGKRDKRTHRRLSKRDERTSEWSVVSGPLSVASCTVESIDKRGATNEPTENRENATNEPTGVGENATNEPKLAAASEDGQSGELNAGTTARNHENLELEFDPEKASESYEQGVARRKAAREERTRKLNEQARREAADAMAARRAFRRQQRGKNGNPGARPKALAAQGIGSLE